MEEEGEYKAEKRGNNSEVRAVIFVPYTPGSKLAKELRQNEELMEKLTGVRIKIQERTGIQLEKLLTKSNHWAGEDCLRAECLMCETRLETGKGKGQNCSSRSMLYETWCETCQQRDTEKAEAEGNNAEDVPLYKYIGETSRSGFERGQDHLRDCRLMSTGSHVLKHYLDRHAEEPMEVMKFRMRGIKFHRSAFERQIHESVVIQANRRHNLLNSKAEFNRCAIPRIGLKMGDNEYKEKAKEEMEEKRKEEELEKKIRKLKSERRVGKRKPKDQEREQDWGIIIENKRRKKEVVESEKQCQTVMKGKTSLTDIRTFFRRLNGTDEQCADQP